MGAWYSQSQHYHQTSFYMPLFFLRPASTVIIYLMAGFVLSPLTAKTAKPARAAFASSEEAFIAAKEATAAMDSERFNIASAAAQQLSNSSPGGAAVTKLIPYLDYWKLRIPLAQARSDSRTPPAPEVLSAAESETRVFLGKHAGTIYADLLRRDWLYVLAKRGDWAAFDAQYPLWALRDEPLLHCWAGLSKVTQDPTSAVKVKQEFSDAINEVKDIGDSCSQLIGALVKAGAMTRADVWKRIQISLDTGSFNAAKRVEAFFTPTASEQAVIAIARQSRQDPASTISQLSGVSAADKGTAWAFIAANGMRKLHADSHEWTKEALKTPTPFYPDDTLAWMARASLRSLDWKSARAAIEKMSPEGRRDPTWTYWLARALKNDSKTEAKADAETLFKSIAGQFNFYGQLAAEELGQLTTIPPKGLPLTDAELAEPARNDGFARALAFYDIGLRPEGNREWNFQLRNMTDRQLIAVAEWACRKNILDRCVNTSDRTKAEFDFQQRFVTPFRDELTPIAKERDVDLAWVYGLIRQESRFIMDARSSVGASGLMQIMPATGRWIAKKVGATDFRVEQLKERDTNLKFGTFYLKSVLDDLDGSPAMASAAYNAGPGRPRAWRATLTMPVETAIFAEMIPFSETRDYVKKVLSNSTYYAALMSGKPQSLKARLGTVTPKAFAATELP
jgi:soluble lytic murein transglycosylase